MLLVYDVYGTLLDIDAATRAAASQSAGQSAGQGAKQGPKKESGQDSKQESKQESGGTFADNVDLISQRWRQRQLAQTWLRSLTGQYTDFWTITCDALDVTLAELGIKDEALREELLALYLNLEAYDEVLPQLEAMIAKGHKLAVLSNGNPFMLERALGNAKIIGCFDAVLSVDTLKVYKPDSRVYEMVTQRFDCTPNEVRFFSSNNWDVAGAGHFGFQTLWINRAGRLWDAPPPLPWREVKSLAAAHQAIC